MASLHNSPSLSHSLSHCPFPQIGIQKHYASFPSCRRGISFVVRAEKSLPNSVPHSQVRSRRRQLLAISVVAPWVSLVNQTSSFAAETKKGFLLVTDRKDGYSFLYPFGWQEVIIEGQDKVFKDVIEPLESVSVNMIPTSKQDIRDFGPPQQVAESLIKRVLVPPSLKTKLIEASEHDVDGKAYYTLEFVAQAPNYTRHALSTVSIGNATEFTPHPQGGIGRKHSNDNFEFRHNGYSTQEPIPIRIRRKNVRASTDVDREETVRRTSIEPARWPASRSHGVRAWLPLPA